MKTLRELKEEMLASLAEAKNQQVKTYDSMDGFSTKPHEEGNANNMKVGSHYYVTSERPESGEADISKMDKRKLVGFGKSRDGKTSTYRFQHPVTGQFSTRTLQHISDENTDGVIKPTRKNK